jgi:hypothetical protein
MSDTKSSAGIKKRIHTTSGGMSEYKEVTVAADKPSAKENLEVTSSMIDAETFSNFEGKLYRAKKMTTYGADPRKYWAKMEEQIDSLAEYVRETITTFNTTCVELGFEYSVRKKLSESWMKQLGNFMDETLIYLQPIQMPTSNVTLKPGLH